MIQIEKDKIYSYKELCESIGEQAKKGGTQRQAQEKRVNSHYNLEKIGRKFKIIEIYQEPKKIIDNRESSFDKCPTLQLFLPYICKAVVQENQKTGDIECFSKEVSRKALLENIFGVDCIISSQIINDIELQLPGARRGLVKYVASEFTNKLSNYLWSNKLKSGCIDKLKKLPIGSVKENYYICVIEERNNYDNTNIVKETKFLRQTKKQHKIIKEIEKNCAEKFGKKSVTLFSSEERDKLNKIIRNKLELNGNIFYFTKYEITINMSEEEVILPYTEKEYENFRMEIFYEFYKRYILKYIDEDVARFSILVRLFNYYLYKELKFFNKSWMPLDKSERKVYEGEIRKLEKGVKELNEEVKYLQQEMKLKTENSK